MRVLASLYCRAFFNDAAKLELFQKTCDEISRFCKIFHVPVWKDLHWFENVHSWLWCLLAGISDFIKLNSTRNCYCKAKICLWYTEQQGRRPGLRKRQGNCKKWSNWFLFVQKVDTEAALNYDYQSQANRIYFHCKEKDHSAKNVQKIRIETKSASTVENWAIFRPLARPNREVRQTVRQLAYIWEAKKMNQILESLKLLVSKWRTRMMTLWMPLNKLMMERNLRKKQN